MILASPRCGRCREILAGYYAPVLDIEGDAVCERCEAEEHDRTCHDCGAPVRFGWYCGACLNSRFGGDDAA